MARRTATSRSRDAARASCRFAIFAHPMSSTRTTAAITMTSEGCADEMMSSLSGRIVGTHPMRSGYSVGKRCRSPVPNALGFAEAASIVRPALSRPIAVGRNRPEWVGGGSGGAIQPDGAHTSTSVSSVTLGCRKSGDATPITTYGSLSIWSLRPITAGSPPKPRRQRPSLMTTTGEIPGV